MSNSSYKLEIDIASDEIHYSCHSGYSRSVRLSANELNDNPEFLDKLSGRDGFLLGTLSASKNMGKLNVSVKEKKYKFYMLISVLFASIMIVSNVLSTKLVSVFGFTIAGAMLVYPLSYIFDYLLTDVYGYQNARRTILATIVCLTMFDLALVALIHLPASQYWHYQSYVDVVFGRMLRTFVSSTIVFAVSFFVSSYIFQKVKIKTKGKSLFKRVVYSLVLSEVLETWLFCLLAFYGIWPLEKMAEYMVVSFITKVTYELIVYGILTKPIIEFIKRKEELDIVDWNTHFTPFAWAVDYDETNNIYKPPAQA